MRVVDSTQGSTVLALDEVLHTETTSAVLAGSNMKMMVRLAITGYTSA
jgi:mannose/fructose-specific phosphotransferase system component IIA